MIKRVATLITFLLIVAPVFGQVSGIVQPENKDVLGMLEHGGQSMAFLVAMYWLKDSNTRRVEETKEFAQMLKDVKTAHKEEIQRMYENHTKELIHCQDQIAILTSNLFEWIKAKDA